MPAWLESYRNRGPNKFWRPVGLIAIILLGFTLRLYNLTYHSLWFDEAVSVRWAQSDVARILEVSLTLTEDRLPPLYYLLLKYWADTLGFSEFSLRYLSVICGVLLIAIVYRLGKQWSRFQSEGSDTVGLLAAQLTALNPFLIWYSQEVRMYALAVLCGCAGVLCFMYLQGRIAPRFSWLGLTLTATIGLYTHLYTGFLWPALGLWILGGRKLWWRVGLPFVLSMSMVSILFLPIALATWQFSGESTPSDPLTNMGHRLSHLFEAFTLWQAPLPDLIHQIVLIGLALFTLWGLIISLRNYHTWLIPLLAAMPFIIASLLLLRSELAFFGERYFIVMLPWILLLQALGVGQLFSSLSRSTPQRAFLISPFGGRSGPVHLLKHIFPWTATLTLVALTAIPISGQWSIPASKEAWRQTLTYMTAYVQPEDAIFIHPEWIRFPYQYYETRLNTPGQTYAYFFAVDEQTDLDAPLKGVIGDHPVIWLIQSHIEQPDPQRRLESWFAARYPLVTELYPPGIILKAYAPGYQRTSLPAHSTPVDLPFDLGLKLVGFDLHQDHFKTQDALFHPPSTWIPVTLYWSLDWGLDWRLGMAGSRLTDTLPYVHLTDEMGQVWGVSLVRGNDSLHFYPPSRWTADQVIVQQVDVNLNPTIPPGQYNLVVGLGEEKQFLQVVHLKE